METGLSTSVAREKLHAVGKNEIITQKRFSALSLFFSQFPTFINGILAIAAVFSFVINDVVDGGFILAILLLNSLFGFFQEYKAEKSLEKLQNYTTPTSRVIRDGKEVQIASVELVPGDIVILSEGDRVPADGKVVEVHHIEIDESILTGESLPVLKDMGDEASLGTLITKGKAHLEVSRTGMRTRFGQIAESLATIQDDKTPLQKQLRVFGRILSLVAAGAALLLIPIGIVQGKELIPLLLLAVSIGVAAIPEGLPAVITIALALGTNRMAKQNAIVRKMPAIETLGSMQIVLVDKTGTLTQNLMRVKKVWATNKTTVDALLQACVLGNTASLIQKGNKDTFDIVGDRTDGALLLFAREQSKEIDTLVQKGRVIDEYVFDTKTKTITTTWKKDGKLHVFVRGAPEAILERSKVGKKEKDEIMQMFESYAKEGLRVIAFGTKVEEHKDTVSRSHLEGHLHFLGIVGIHDPPRPEVHDALRSAKEAGIQTIMVTGDNELTALAIAKEIGLIDKDEDVITGDELAKLSDQDLTDLLLKTRVFARAKPHDKLRLATLLKERGFVVGVTGDGVNDALALKKADVGIAMGATGTDVAKEASDLVLLDDNFATLMKAVEEGRAIYHNIVKAIVYLLAGNLSELLLILFATLIGMPSPLIPTQILWINIVTDGLPALALASDTKHPNILKEKPRDPRLPLLTRDRMLFILGIGVGLSIYLLFIFHLLLQGWSEGVARTVIFNLLVFSHLTLSLIVRRQSIFRANKLLLASILLTIILQVIISTTPFFQELFHLELK